MSNNKGLIAAVFLIGCATGGVASRVSTPAARAATSSTRWEYICPENANVQRMNDKGAEGWELAAMTVDPRVAPTADSRVISCFKRALE